MKHKILLTILPLLSIMLTACSADPVDTTGSISGTIRDAISNSALPGASVSLSPSGRSTVTGTDGHYQFMDVEMGEYTVSVKKVDYKDDSKKATILVGQNTQVDFILVSAIDGKLPTVGMIGASATDVSAILVGTLTDVGSSAVTSHGFYWSTTPNLSTEELLKLGNNSKYDFGRTEAPKERFECSVSKLSPNTTYYVRAFATNALGTAFSSREERFTTTAAPEPPRIETGTATNVSSNTASMDGNILSIGCQEGITAYGHCWSSETKEPTTDYEHTDLGSSKTTGRFTSELKNLNPNTIYYIRAYARNKYGITYGEVAQLTTTRAEVKLNTSSVTDIIHNEATCGGKITDYGGHTITERGVCWNTNTNPTVAHSHSASTDNTENFSVRLTNLKETTSYHVRAYVKTGTGETYYGQDVQFTTTQVITVPVLSGVSVSGVTYKKATFTAKVTSLGNGTLKRSGFCYSTSPNPTIKNSTLSCGTASDLQATASSLSAETTYYVRAFAENEKDIAYGEEQSFTTKERPEAGDINREEWGDDENWN